MARVPEGKSLSDNLGNPTSQAFASKWPCQNTPCCLSPALSFFSASSFIGSLCDWEWCSSSNSLSVQFKQWLNSAGGGGELKAGNTQLPRSATLDCRTKETMVFRKDLRLAHAARNSNSSPFKGRLGGTLAATRRAEARDLGKAVV